MKRQDERTYGKKLLENATPEEAFGIAAANSLLAVLEFLLDEKGVDIDSRSGPGKVRPCTWQPAWA